MKIGSAVPPPKAEGVKNKRPQLAIEQVFKTLRSGLKIYVGARELPPLRSVPCLKPVD